MQGAHFIEIPHTGHGFGKQRYWSQPFDDSIDALIRTASAAKPTPPAPPSAAALEVQARRAGPAARVSMGRTIACGRHLSLGRRRMGDHRREDLRLPRRPRRQRHRDQLADGISGTSKTPQQTGAELLRVAAMLESANLPLFLGGYSFGAEVTPFVLETWSETARRNVAGQILIGPGETASFEISPLDWIFRAKETPRRVADQVRALRVPTFCLAGQQEEARDTACDEMAAVGRVSEIARLSSFQRQVRRRRPCRARVHRKAPGQARKYGRNVLHGPMLHPLFSTKSRDSRRR